MFVVRVSKPGFYVAGIFLAFALMAFLWSLYSMKTNPGDSGESAVLFVLFTLPWLFFLRSFEFPGYSGMVVGWLLVLFNAFILYGLLGGVRWSSQDDSKHSDRNGTQLKL